MTALWFGRRAFLLFVIGAIGCGRNGVNPTAPPPGVDTPLTPRYHKTFHYTGEAQPFKVPEHVTAVDVVAWGAAGGGQTCVGSYCYGDRYYFGRGGRVHAILPVQPGETLYVYVGGKGSDSAGGFNGGGNPGPGGGSNGGGGATDVRANGKSTSDRVLVAGGGGGEGTYRSETGGNGGGEAGGIGGSYCYTGYNCVGGGGGHGGTQDQGGSGGFGGVSYQPGQPGATGTLGYGGAGGQAGCYYTGNCSCGYANGCPGAGGGGGYFGGGGGGGGAAEYASIYGGPGAGGGGGSSWAEPKAKDFRTWAGWKKAVEDGLVVFSWQ